MFYVPVCPFSIDWKNDAFCGISDTITQWGFGKRSRPHALFRTLATYIVANDGEKRYDFASTNNIHSKFITNN